MVAADYAIQVVGLESQEENTENKQSVPTTQTSAQQQPKKSAPPSTHDPKKDSANYDKNGNYKPVDKMTPDEIKKIKRFH
ncbi:hypothetical protein [Bacillus bingmayongensis]|uniref:hypothetical protein n=1 Tax=Bacillus bingmayongensis TaxID=1150157 RepID=UPI0002DF260D|nr:hypothetical protein [Bacillus bingmayongensis]